MRLRRGTSRNWKGSNNALIDLAPIVPEFENSRTQKLFNSGPLEVKPRWFTLQAHEGHHSPEERGFRPAQDLARPERSRAAVDGVPAGAGRRGPDVRRAQRGPPEVKHVFSLQHPAQCRPAVDPHRGLSSPKHATQGQGGITLPGSA